MTSTSMCRRMLNMVLGAVVLVMTGCSSAPEEKKPDPDAVKRELEELNKARKKEWKQ